MTVVVLRNCPQHGLQSCWLKAWVDPDQHYRGHEYRCLIADHDSREDPYICDLVLGEPREFTSMVAVTAAVLEETKSYTDRPRRVVELVERRLRRRPR